MKSPVKKNVPKQKDSKKRKDSDHIVDISFIPLNIKKKKSRDFQEEPCNFFFDGFKANKKQMRIKPKKRKNLQNIKREKIRSYEAISEGVSNRKVLSSILSNDGIYYSLIDSKGSSNKSNCSSIIYAQDNFNYYG